MAEIRGSVITDDGVRLAYKTVGDGPRNLLLLHGWGSANSWNGFIGALDPLKFRAIAFDIRGHGESDKVTTGFSDERFARDAFAVADATNARKFISVGFSMSGRFVQYLPLLSPERVESMVIIAGAPASAIELPEVIIADWVGRAADCERLRQIPVMFAVNPDPALLDEYADDAVKASAYALEATLRMLLTSFEDRIKGRSPMTPTLVLAGKADKLLGPDVQRAIAGYYPGSSVVELDCGHEILVEKPAETAGHVVKFVGDLAS